MTQNLAKYHSRAPRYILQSYDNYLVRLAGPNQIPWEEGTEIQNVSLSGLAFTAPVELCPIIGEVIKIQFEVPGGKLMACLALVTRIENSTQNKMLVGVQFQKLQPQQRLAIAQSIAKKLKSQASKEQHLSQVTSQTNWAKLVLWTSLLIFGYFLMFRFLQF